MKRCCICSKCAGLELVRGPFYCAVSIHHKLAAKDRLQITDLYGENLLLMHRGWSHYVDELRDDLWAAPSTSKYRGF